MAGYGSRHNRADRKKKGSEKEGIEKRRDRKKKGLKKEGIERNEI